MKWLLVLLVACGTAASTSSRRDPLDSIPNAAAAALRRAAAGAQIEHVEREGDLYEGTWHVGGLEREAAVTTAGELVELDEEVSSAQVPAAVRAMAIARLPDAQSIKFVKLMNGNFEAEAIVDGKEQGDITLAPDGRELGGDYDDADDDDADDD